MADKKTLQIAPLPFGIPQLDQLLGYPDLESVESKDTIGCMETTTSLAIVGQDGTGKSIFALHLASTYRAILRYVNHKGAGNHASPFVFYVSSDLGFNAANRVWENFYLDYPWNRYVPFTSANDIEYRRETLRAKGNLFRVNLRRCSPEKYSAAASASAPADEAVMQLGDHLRQLRRGGSSDTDSAEVAFIDLESQTTGDDWLFVSRLLTSVPRLKNAPPNLLILDSVAGFETLVGEYNSFGESMTRRARIAQLIRAAGENWHTVFIVEEPDEGKHHPEEYVTDTVVHLRRHGEAERVRRVVEVEKSRARSFGSGEHPFEVRDGRGSSTRGWENPDDPYNILHEKFWQRLDDKRRNRWNAYIQVFPSLNYLSKEFARKRSATRSNENGGAPRKNIPFGIPYLDNMLAVKDFNFVQGLPEGTVTSLIGDEGTRKNSIAEHFLADGFRSFPRILEVALKLVKDWKAGGRKQTLNQFLRQRGCDASWWQNTIALPADVKARLAERCTEWMKRFPDREEDLDELAASKKWSILNEEELTEKLLSLEKSGGSPGSSFPLMTRWDAFFYYKEIAEDMPEDEHTFMLALSILRKSSGLLTPVVLVATYDTSAERIADLIIDSHEKSLEDVLSGNGLGELTEERRHALLRVVERFVLVRRVELQDATAPEFWHTIHSGAVHALYLLGNDASSVQQATDRVSYAGDVRVVVSDLRLVRDTYPSVAADPLFLPTVVFRLRRLGVTVLLVDTDNGRPDLQPSHPMNGALRSLVDHQIYTWKVPFFSEQRIAISVIPSMVESGIGVIRELRTERRRLSSGEMQDRVEVDPHFELYMGIEEGKPVAIPLQVVLYAETPAFLEYISAEKGLFSRLFSPTAVNDSVMRVETTDYDSLRDYCRLPADTRLPYTLVFMVDGFWALGRNGALRNQKDYLFGKLRPTDLIGYNADGRSDEYIDVFHLYRRTLQEVSSTPDPARRPFRWRHDFFKQTGTPALHGRPTIYYESRIPDEDETIDRVPFMWDFGFLLCNERQWNSAAEVKLMLRDRRAPLDASGERPHLKVKTIWNRLCRMGALEPFAHEVGDASPSEEEAPRPWCHRRRPNEPEPEAVSWREFFDACLTVAKSEEKRTSEPVRAFDLATSGPDSLSCLFLEIWFSEILKDALELKACAERLGSSGLEELSKRASKKSETTLNRLYSVSKSKYKRSADEQDKTHVQAASGDDPYLQEFLGWEYSGKPERLGKSYEQLREWWARESDEWRRAADTISKGPDFIRLPPVEQEKKLSKLRRDWRFATVYSSAPGQSLQLYKTWLLLLEVLDFSQLTDAGQPFQLNLKHELSNSTVASRHWYKTACVAAQVDCSVQGEGRVVQTKVPVRLPGHFSVRGDWFLAVAKGSRSSRLADRALDMLSSRRANRARLQWGMGLPTRDLLEGRGAEEIRTRLTITTPDATYNATYGNLICLGGKYGDENGTKIHWDPRSFVWFFRSGFHDYDRHAATIHSWLHRLLSWTVQYRYENRATWWDRSSFTTYDQLEDGDMTQAATFPSFVHFAKSLDAFADDLGNASLKEDAPKRFERSAE